MQVQNRKPKTYFAIQKDIHPALHLNNTYTLHIHKYTYTTHYFKCAWKRKSCFRLLLDKAKSKFLYLRQRPYHVESTSSRPITEVKQRWARLVLGWVTAWEPRVPLAFFFAKCYFNTVTQYFLVYLLLRKIMNWKFYNSSLSNTCKSRGLIPFFLFFSYTWKEKPRKNKNGKTAKVKIQKDENAYCFII